MNLAAPIIINNKQQLTLNINAFASNQAYQIYYNEQYCGELTVISGQIQLNLDENAPSVTIDGFIAGINCSVRAPQNVLFCAHAQITQELAINCRHLTLDSTLSSHKIRLNCTTDLIINTAPVTQILEGSAENITVNTPLLLENNSLNAIKNVTLNHSLRASVENKITGTTIACLGYIAGAINKLKASETINLQHDIFSTAKLTLAAPTINQYGITFCLGQYKVLSQHYYCHPDSMVKAPALFKFIGNEWESQGKITLDQTAFILANKITWAGDVRLPLVIHLQTQELAIEQHAAIGWLAAKTEPDTTAPASYRVFQVDQKLQIAPEAQLELEGAVLKINQLIADGILAANRSKFRGVSLEINKKITLTNSDTQFRKGITIQRHAESDIKSTYVHTARFNSTSTKPLTISDSIIKTIISCLRSPVSFSKINYKAATVSEFPAAGSVTDSLFDVTGQFNHTHSTTPDISNTSFKINVFNLPGVFTLGNTSNLQAQVMVLNGVVKIGQSGFIVKNLVIELPGIFTANSSSVVAVDDFNNLGTSTIEDSYININHLNNPGTLTLQNIKTVKKMVPLIRGELNSFGDLFLTNAEITAYRFAFNNQYTVTSCTLNSIMLYLDGKGKIDADSQVNTAFYNSSPDSETEIQGAEINCDFSLIAGKLSLDQVKMIVRLLSQYHGAAVTDNTEIHVNQQITSDAGSSLTANNNTKIAGKNAIAVLSGDVKLNHSVAVFKTLTMDNRAELDNSVIEVLEEGLLVRPQTYQNNSRVTAGNLIVHSAVKIDKTSTLDSKTDLTITPDGSINGSGDKSQVQARNKLDVFGALEISYGAQAVADTINIYNRLKAEFNGSVSARKDLMLGTRSKVTLNDALLRGRNVEINSPQLGGSKGSIVADNRLTARLGANSSVGELFLQGDQIWFSPSSQFHGNKFAVKGRVYENNTTIDMIEEILIDVKYLYDIGGAMSAGELVQLKAQRGLLRLGSSIETKNTVVNALFALNFLSITDSCDSYYTKALLSSEIGCFSASYNKVNQSVINLSGFSVNAPNLPSRWQAAFTPHKLLECGELLLNMIFPQFSGLIDIGFKVLPVAYKVGKGLYSFAQNPGHHWGLICDYMENIDDKSALDYLDLALAAKGLIVSGINAVHGFTECGDTFSKENFQAVPHQLESISLSTVANAANIVFGPSNVQESVIDINASATLTDNSISKSLFSINAGANASYQKTEHSLYKINAGVEAAVKLSMSGEKLDNSEGHIYTDVFSETYGDVEWGSVETGDLIAQDTDIKNIDDFVNTRGELYGEVGVSRAITVNNPHQAYNITENIRHKGAVTIRGEDVTFVKQTSEYARGFEKAKGNFDVVNGIDAEAGVFLKADEGDVIIRDTVKAEKGTVVIDAYHDAINQESDITGAETYVRARTGKATNIGGNLVGNYVEIHSYDDIENISADSEVKDRHGTHTEHKQSTIAGGKSTSHGNTGIALISDHGKFKNRGITVAKGNIVGDLYNGVDSQAEITTIVSYKHEKSWLGLRNKIHIRVQTQVSQAVIASEEGCYDFTIHRGGASFVGTTLSSHTTPHIHLLNQDGIKHNIVCEDIIGKREEYERDSWFGGLFESELKRFDEFSSPTVIRMPKDVPFDFDAGGGDFITRGTDIEGGIPQVSGQNWINTNSTLHHSYQYNNRGVRLRIGDWTVIGLATPRDKIVIPLTTPDPICNKLKALRNGGTEAAIDAALEVLNTSNEITQAARQRSWLQGLLDHTGLNQYKDPKLSLNFTGSHIRSNYETSGSGYINIDGMRLNLSGDAVFDGVNTKVNGDVRGHARNFIVNGRVLSSSYQSSSSEIGFSSRLSKLYDLSVSGSSSYAREEAHVYHNASFDVSGDFDMDLDLLLLDGGVLRAKRLIGHAGHVSIISHTSERHSEQGSASASTDGSFSFKIQNEDSVLIDSPAGIITDEAIDDQFKTEGITSEGVIILSHQQVSLNAPITSKPVEQYRKGKSMGFSGNINDFTGSVAIPEPPASGYQPAKRIASATIDYAKTDYQATAHTAIHGDKGTSLNSSTVTGKIITDSSSPDEIHHNQHYNHHFTIPLPNHQTASQLAVNLRWAAAKLSPQRPVYLTHPKAEPLALKKKITKQTGKKPTVKHKLVRNGKKLTTLKKLVLPLDDSALLESLSLDEHVVYINNSKQKKSSKPAKTKKANGDLPDFLISPAQAAESNNNDDPFCFDNSDSGIMSSQGFFGKKNSKAHNNPFTVFDPDQQYVYHNNTPSQTPEQESHCATRLRGLGRMAMGLTQGAIALVETETIVGSVVAATQAANALDNVTTGAHDLITGTTHGTSYNAITDSLNLTPETAELAKDAFFSVQNLLFNGHEIDPKLLKISSVGTLSSAATAAAVSKTTEKGWHWKTRISGFMQAGVGAIEGLLGAGEALATLPSIIGPAAGGAAVADGLDRFQAGAMTAFTGEEYDTNFVMITGSFGWDTGLAEQTKNFVLLIPAGYAAVSKLISQASISKFSIETIGLFKKQMLKPENVYADINSFEAASGTSASVSNYEKLLSSVKTYGIKEPIKFVETAKGNFVVEGRLRFFAAKESGLEKIQATRTELPYGNYKTPEDLTRTADYAGILKQFGF
ncbi:ParB/Srx family N-terminal domain-containing protein [Legionella dresdenensis]|uniref:ParB/Srx family N-terminal domain-containing protein n=1 Tax=Legionella dresdenensis TaxID=450200 RepID=A0ABV8CCW5_9GAMM